MPLESESQEQLAALASLTRVWERRKGYGAALYPFPPRARMRGVKPTRSSINGAWAEGLTAQYLEDAGLNVTQRNYRVRGGEIDLIALEGIVTVFVEVKQRTRVSHGTPGDYITPRKAALIRRTALEYLGRDDVACRFDAVLIEGDARAFSITWLKDAF